MCVGGGSRAQSHTLKLPHAARLSCAIDGHHKSEGSFFQSRSLLLPVGQSISQTTGWKCNYLSTLSRTEQPCRYGKWAISSQVMICSHYSVLFKVFFVQGVLTTENEAWLDVRTIGGHTFDCGNKFKVRILCLQANTLILRIEVPRSIKFPATTKLNALFIHVIHVL